MGRALQALLDDVSAAVPSTSCFIVDGPEDARFGGVSAETTDALVAGVSSRDRARDLVRASRHAGFPEHELLPGPEGFTLVLLWRAGLAPETRERVRGVLAQASAQATTIGQVRHLFGIDAPRERGSRHLGDADLQVLRLPEDVAVDPVVGEPETPPLAYTTLTVFRAVVRDGHVSASRGFTLDAHGRLVRESMPTDPSVAQLQSQTDVSSWFGRSPQRVSDPVVVLAAWRRPNLFHWLLDSVSRLFLLEGTIEHPAMRLLVDRGLTGFQRDSLRLLGFGDRLLVADRDHVQAESIVLSGGLGWGSAMRMSPLVVDYARWLRDRLGVDDVGGTERILVSRADAGSRRVIDEAALEATLRPLGFERVVLGTQTMADQIRTFAEADVVVAPHGAGLANLLFSGRGTKVVEIFSDAGLHDSVYRRMASLLGQPYARVVGAAVGDARPHFQDVDVAPQQVLRALQTLEVA